MRRCLRWCQKVPISAKVPFFAFKGDSLMIQMKVSDGGRVVIPSEIRQFMAIKEGDTVLWTIEDGIVTLTTRDQQLRQLHQSRGAGSVVVGPWIVGTGGASNVVIVTADQEVFVFQD